LTLNTASLGKKKWPNYFATKRQFFPAKNMPKSPTLMIITLTPRL
jgi:hypothetical protein